jgi:hypothetical protein
MKPKWIFMVLAGLMVCSIFSTSQGADKFYYGGGNWHGFWEADNGRSCWLLRDSLCFNFVLAFDLPQASIDSLAVHSLQALAGKPYDNDSPTYWSRWSHYTLWEAEGLLGSWVNLQYANWGVLVNDGSASGGKAMRFIGPGTPDTIQWGPSYEQERKVPGDTTIIKYTAEFRLKYLLYIPRGAMGSGPPTPVCKIMVVDTVHHSILKDRILYIRNFSGGGGGYQIFPLEYTVPDNNRIEFQIQWFGQMGSLYIDYVKVYDGNGSQLMSGLRDSVIIAYVSQSWVTTPIQGTGEPVVYRWYMRDQPPSIDCYMPYVYIDNILKENQPNIPGSQFYCSFYDTFKVHEYLLRTEPVEYMIDPYPLEASDTGSNFQVCIDSLVKTLDYNKRKAQSLSKDLWVAIQAYAVGPEKTGPVCDSNHVEYVYDGVSYCLGLRDPTPNEVRLQTFLAMCYGADAVLNYQMPYWINYGESPPVLYTGLYDTYNDTPTVKWKEIKNFTGPRVEKLGPVFNQLTWQGACSDDSVGSFILRDGDSSYIKNIAPYNHFPPYVEVGFFRGPFIDGVELDYFMLVNRRCLSEEGDSFRVFIEKERGPEYFFQDRYTDSIVA